LAEDEKIKTTWQEKQARKAAVQAAKLEKKHLEWELFREDKPTRCNHLFFKPVLGIRDILVRIPLTNGSGSNSIRLLSSFLQ
jgi:hypothetical protein